MRVFIFVNCPKRNTWGGGDLFRSSYHENLGCKIFTCLILGAWEIYDSRTFSIQQKVSHQCQKIHSKPGKKRQNPFSRKLDVFVFPASVWISKGCFRTDVQSKGARTPGGGGAPSWERRERNLQDRFEQVQETLPRIYMVYKKYLLLRDEKKRHANKEWQNVTQVKRGCLDAYAYLEFPQLAGPGASLLVVDAVHHRGHDRFFRLRVRVDLLTQNFYI